MTKHIEFKNASGLHIAEVLANKGIYFQVRDDAGEEYAVPKKQVVRGPWEEIEDDEEELNNFNAKMDAQDAEDEAEFQALKDNAASHSLLGAALVQAQAEPAPKVKKNKADPTPKDPNLVTLKQLCFELGVIPRIARRRLRKALGQVGTGSRWEWTKDSAEYSKVKLALAAPVTKEEADDKAE